MEPDWINIFTTSKPYLAEMAKDILEENDFDVVIINKQDSLYLIGDIEVYTKPENVIRAKFLIKDI
jgi:hypothetical protein